ncbi:hypothetical protein NRB56_28880 [Nocardia sp. RB56]|uniref:Uncharacterized protein n=1 Tax=Nocardia aurantia TaxID=2585199 RepID=A0A7K0DNH9_9NOCA|nr:hypothetical protein [Nocardia aurantia]
MRWSAVNHANGTPAAGTRSSMAITCRGLVAKATSPGIPASRQRSRSPVHDSPKMQFPVDQRVPARRRIRQKHPDPAFSVRPAVPEYCRCTPADLRPFFQETGFVGGHRRTRISEMLVHVITHPVDIPVRPAQQPLHPLRT